MPKMNDAKAQKRQALINRASGKTDEPMVLADSKTPYRVQLTTALCWYAREADTKQRKAWAIAYFKKLKETAVVKHFEDLPEFDFYSLGVLCRMKSNESFLSEQELNTIEKLKAELMEKVAKPKAVVVAKVAVPVPTIQDRIAEKAREFAAEIDGKIDEFVMEGCPANFKIPMNGMTAPVAKYVASFYQRELALLREVQEGKDAQLVEGYSNFNKTQLKRYIALLETILSNSEQAKKIVRKPTVRKAKPAGVVVAKMKYKASDEELGLKSISAPSIVNSSELWVFNTKTRKLIVYRAAEGVLLTVKGTTILNYDTKTSSAKTLRKPKEQLDQFAGMTKRTLGTAYKAIKCKEATPNGRINEDCILFKVFQ